MSTITLIPLAGRDYQSAADVEQALKDNRDFTVADMSSRWDGKPCNINDLRRAGIVTAKVRYSRGRRVCFVEVAA